MKKRATRRHRSQQKQCQQVKGKIRKYVDKTLTTQAGLISEIFGRPIKKQELAKLRAASRKKTEHWFDSTVATFGTDCLEIL